MDVPTEEGEGGDREDLRKGVTIGNSSAEEDLRKGGGGGGESASPRGGEQEGCQECQHRQFVDEEAQQDSGHDMSGKVELFQ